MDMFRCQVETAQHRVCRGLTQLCSWPQIPKGWHTGFTLPCAQSRGYQMGCLICDLWGHWMERRAQLLPIYAYVVLRESHCHKPLCFRCFFSMWIASSERERLTREAVWSPSVIFENQMGQVLSNLV